jgi:hypothetical protein
MCYSFCFIKNFQILLVQWTHLHPMYTVSSLQMQCLTLTTAHNISSTVKAAARIISWVSKFWTHPINVPSDIQGAARKFPDFFRSYLYTYSLLSKYSPSVAMHLIWWCCHCWKHFWNFCCGIAFSAITIFGHLHCPEIFSSLRQTLFLETTRNHSEPNQGNRVGVPFQ